MEGISGRCKQYSKKAFCYFVFPPCADQKSGGDPSPAYLCREDCELLQYDVCGTEFKQEDNQLIAVSF